MSCLFYINLGYLQDIPDYFFIVSPLIIYCLPAYFNFTIPKLKKD